jgi:hypothetical protein
LVPVEDVFSVDGEHAAARLHQLHEGCVESEGRRQRQGEGGGAKREG